MSFENRVLAVVESVTNVPATFTNGTLFLNTIDSKTAVKVFNAIFFIVFDAYGFSDRII